MVEPAGHEVVVGLADGDERVGAIPAVGLGERVVVLDLVGRGETVVGEARGHERHDCPLRVTEHRPRGTRRCLRCS